MNAFQLISTKKQLNIAIKLSILESHKIAFKEILNLFPGYILIDAESERLDLWLENTMLQYKINENDLQRIIITVQAKRADSYDQLKRLESMGVSIALVRGNNSYLSGVAKVTNVYNQILKLHQNFSNILFFGFSSFMINKLKINYNLEINEISKLSLYGEKSTSAQWIFYAAGELSIEGKKYVQRRDGTGQYVLSNLKEINGNINFLYVDTHSKSQFLSTLNEITNYEFN